MTQGGDELMKMVGMQYLGDDCLLFKSIHF